MSTYTILARGLYSHSQVEQDFNADSWGAMHDAATQAAITERWGQMLERAEELGRSLYDTPLYRLGAFEEKDGGLVLSYGLTSYRAYATTRDLGPKRLHHHNADPIGTALLAITVDGLVPIGRRSQSAEVNPGRFFTFGGFFDVNEDTQQGKPDVFNCAAREWSEETGLAINREQMDLLSIVYGRRHPHPEIAFMVMIPETADELRDANWRAELSDLTFVPVGELQAFAAKHAHEFTDTLLGAIEAFSSIGRDK